MPYVREMNLWIKNVDQVEIVAPLIKEPITTIDASYIHSNLKFNKISAIDFTSALKICRSLFLLPIIFGTIYRACRRADHIHLRCPGNIGLLGCFVQIFFPSKTKTAKYAGNWDPNAKQPSTYKLQRSILSNTSLTKNMSVLVYGNWEKQTNNIKSFFTASFHEKDKQQLTLRDYSANLKFIFVGGLVPGKCPLFAIKIVEHLNAKDIPCFLDIYGEGPLFEELNRYLHDNNLRSKVVLKGNVTTDILKAALNSVHFSILASKSEGWPKAIAEAMFFGVVPIATAVSCVPDMLGHGQRGIIIEPELEKAVAKIMASIKSENLKQMSLNALTWAQEYTLESFESEVKKLL